MRRDKDEIENLFGTALSNLEITPTEEMEARLMSSIDFVQPKKRRRPLWLWMGGLMTAVLCLFLFNLDLTLIQQIHFGQDKRSKNKTQEFSYTEDKSKTQDDLLTNEVANNLSTPHKPFTQTSINSDNQLLNNKISTLNKTASSEQLYSTKNVNAVTKITGKELNLGKINSANLDQEDVRIIPAETSLVAVNSVNVEELGQDSTLKDLPVAGSLLTENVDDYDDSDDQSNNNHTDDRPKNKLSLSYQLAFPKQQNTIISKTDSSWSINRGLLNATEFNFTHVCPQHFTFSSGLRYERSKENWNSDFEYEGIITKDTIIDGEPATIDYFGTINNYTNRTYNLSQLSLPFTIGYRIGFGKFDLDLEVGGLMNVNFIKERITLLNNAIVNSTTRETVFAFAPQTKLNLDYMWGRTGMGITVNYQFQKLNRSSLLEQALNRNNIGFGLRLLCTF